MHSRRASSIDRNPASGAVIVNYPSAAIAHRELSGRAPSSRSGGPVWVDLPGADSSRVLETLESLNFTKETVTYCLVSRQRPQGILHANTLFVSCHAALARKRSLFVSYPIRMCIRPDVALTIHGVSTRDPQPLQRILPAVDRAIDGGPQHFAAILLEAVVASYERLFDRPVISGALATPVTSRCKESRLAKMWPRLQVLSHLLHSQKDLLAQLRPVGMRFLAGGTDLVDELTSRIASVEIWIETMAHTSEGRTESKSPRS